LEQRLIHVRQLGIGPRQVGQVLLAAGDQAHSKQLRSVQLLRLVATHAARPAQRLHRRKRR
jgi:hypothetical protein